MQILLVSTYGFDPAFPSRPETLQARALAERGHAVVAYEYFDRRYPGQSQMHDWLPGGIPVHRSRTLGFFAPHAMLRMLIAERPDVVHIHHMRNLLSYQSVWLARQLGIPTVMTVHGLLHDGDLVADRERPLEKPLRFDNLLLHPQDLLIRLASGAHPRRATRNYLIHAPLLHVDRLLALSQHEADLLELVGADPARISVLPNAVDLSAFATDPPPVAESAPIVLFIGQLVPRKGFDVLARAMAPVLAEIPEARFIFIGHNRLGEGELREIAERSGASHALEIRGRVSEEEKVQLLQQAAVVAAPSRYEGFGIPLIEAMAAARPVVTCDVAACNEIVNHERNGLIVPYTDHAALAAALVRLLRQREFGAALGAQGRRDAFARYGATRLAHNLETLYTSLQRP